MEMALLPQSPLCSRNQPTLMLQPTTLGGGPDQSFLRTSRFVRSRIIRCRVASSDFPSRKSRKMVYPKVKVAAFRGYVPRLPAESSTKKSIHHNSDERTIGTFNRLLSTDTDESTSSRDLDTAEVDLLEDASSSLASGEVDVAEEGSLDMFEVDLSRNALINISLGVEEEEVDEAAVEKDKFDIDSTRVQFGSAAVQELDPKDEAKAKEDIFVAGSSGITTNSDAMREMVDEAKVEEDRVDVDLLGFGLNDEAGDIPEIFDVDVSGHASRSGKWYVGEPWVQEATSEMDILGTASNSASLGKVNAVDDAKVEKYTFQVDDLSSASYSAIYMAVESSEEISEVDNDQWQHPALPSTSIEDKANNETHESLGPEPRTVVRVKEQDKLDFSVDEGSAFDTHEEDQQVVDYDWQEQNVTTFDEQEQDQCIIGCRRQDKSIVAVPEQNQSVVVYSKPDQSIVASHRKDESVAAVLEKIQSVVGYKKPDQSIVASHKEDQSIVSVPEQIKSIVGYSKAEQSIIGLHKQQQSVVHIPQEKQSIVGFHKQDLSTFSSSKESQTKKLDIPESRDALRTEEIEAKAGDYTPQKTDEDKLHAKSDVDLLQKHKEDFTEEAPEMINSKKINEEHLAMVEEKKSISMGEEQWIVTDESISVVEVEMETGEDKSLHLPGEEDPWVEDEVGISEDEEHYEVEETFVSPEQDMQESPQDEMDPQELQRMLRELAEKNYLLGNKFFVFPEVLKADSTIALYFNRDLSAIANEPDVLIKGAFNGWKWRFFTEKLHKSELGGDWWSCKLYIPKQAYRFDFVFFNGRTMYENNGKNDFVIQIESTMDEHSFADFLVEEKQRELERFAIEEAERKKQTEEEKRMKEEKAAHEAAMAQAKAEIVTKKNKLQNVLDSAKGSVDNLWYIEPISTVQEATVRVYYNRHSRPLIHSAEIWMHGGYNNWIDGLSFAERLVHHDDKDGDWWYADVVLPQRAYVLDWVFADGPPGNARIYDNNGRQDFHSILPSNMTEEEYWAEEEQRIYTRLQQERREREEAIRMKLTFRRTPI